MQTHTTRTPSGPCPCRLPLRTQPAPSGRFVFEALPRRITMHLPDNRLLVAGQGPGAAGGSASMPHGGRAARKGVLRAMLAQVHSLGCAVGG